MKQLSFTAMLALAAMIMLCLPIAQAHCDHVEGPVIKAAQQAIAERNANYTVIWVQPEDSQEAIQLFETALPKITQGDETARTRFFEDLVRLHRKGEGAEYTGIKPEGAEMEPIIVAADAAVETGNLAVLHPYVSDSQERHDEVVARYRALMALKGYAPDDIAAGRAYVDAYVDFMKFVEGEEEEHSDPAALAEASSGRKSTVHAGYLAAGLVAASALTLGVVRIARRRTKRARTRA